VVTKVEASRLKEALKRATPSLPRRSRSSCPGNPDHGVNP